MALARSLAWETLHPFLHLVCLFLIQGVEGLNHVLPSLQKWNNGSSAKTQRP